MENNTEIWNELREISPNTAAIGNKNVFTVPTAYFETLPDLILERVKTGRNLQSIGAPEQEYIFPDGLNINNLYTIPKGYFDVFPQQLMSRIHAEEQNQNISVSGELAMLSPLLNSIDRKMPYQVPAGYFDGLAGNVLTGSAAPEYTTVTHSGSSLLHPGPDNKNPYRVPQGYFDGLADTILNRVKEPAAAKLVSLPRPMRWLKYAAAAIVVGVIATASLLFFNKQVTLKNIDPLQNLSQVSEQEMMNYLENQSSPAVAVDTSNSVASIDLNNDSDPKDLLNDISDNELQQYIDEHVSAKDLIIN